MLFKFFKSYFLLYHARSSYNIGVSSGLYWHSVARQCDNVSTRSQVKYEILIGIDEKCDYVKKAVEMKEIYTSSFNATIKSETELSVFLKHKNGETPAFGNW